MSSLSILLTLFLALPSARAETAALPQAPEAAVHDAGGLLRPEARDALQSVLVEHDRLTGEQIVFAVIREPELADPKERANALYSHWQLGVRGRGLGLLILVNVATDEAVQHAGYGFTAILNPERLERILDEVTRPTLRSHDVSSALVETALELLQALESPLVASGELNRILSSVPRVLRAEQEIAPTWVWITLLILGAAIAWLTLRGITEPDAHYTGSGWSRAYPGEIWRKLRARKAGAEAALGGSYGEW